MEMEFADADNSKVELLINQAVAEEMAKFDVAQKYNVVLLYDSTSLARSDADRVYKAISSFAESRPILLVLHSTGGSIAAAYFIAKLCRDYSANGFSVVVPRQAKSAATLICCGAERIHMGSLSELGPIDPQIENVPALAYKYSIEHLAELVKRYPAATEMFSNYLAKTLRIEELGYYERVAESAVQYAERLLASRQTVPRDEVALREIPKRLVYSYKDHGFAIDERESEEIFGSAVVRHNTDEYGMGNRIYGLLDFLAFVARGSLKRAFYFTGTADNGCSVSLLR